MAEWMYGEHISPVAKLPFTARVELERVNRLADGTSITHKTFNMIARDAAGRTYNEARKWVDGASGEATLLRIELYDPISKTRTTIYPQTRLVRYWTQAVPLTGSVIGGISEKGQPETKRESLGTDTIEGMAVRGTRTSQTYAAGAVGNDRPITVSTESWYSDELKINLLTRRNDPRYGVQTVRVTELRREEPAASMFAVPPDYRVSDERGAPRELARTEGSLSLPPLPEGVERPGVNGTSIPTCVYCPDPSYSDEARAKKISGSVIVRVVVNATGHTENAVVMRGLGHGLDEMAIETVQNWEFRPAVNREGVPVAVAVPIEVTFKIK